MQAPTSRLLAQYRRADADTIRRGREWYDAALQRMEALADETGYTVEQAVAVLAITSPGAQLVTNLRWTEEALRSRGTAKVGRFPNAMAPKIAAVLSDPDVAAEYVRGPKVGPFHRAILGDHESLVLDRWALYAAGLENREENHKLTAAERSAIERAYRRAAERVGETVRDFQAIVWIAVRESTGAVRGGKRVAVRYADIV